MRIALAIVATLGLLVSCVDKEAEARKKADQQKSFMEAESKARAEAEAAEAKKALDDATAGCASSKAEACVDLGRIHAEGKGVPADKAKAVEAFAKACAASSKDGCRFAAEHEADPGKKLESLKALCGLGDADGCMTGAVLADELVKAGKLPEPKKMAERDAVVLLGKACDVGAARACTARGVALVNDDPKAAVDALTRGCDLGEPTACWQLATMLSEGKGVKKKDPARAAELLKKACDAGLTDACAK